jgi:glycosyltransferase involved in cell wall biosynthesis
MPTLLLHAFSTFAVGGPQVRFATLANHFGPRYRHAIVAMDGNLAATERLDPALDVTYPTIRLPKNDTLGNATRIRAALREIRPDALFTSNWGTIEWAIANRWPIVRHVHVEPLVRHVHIEDGFGPEERTTQIPRRVWMRRLFLARRTVVVPSLTLQKIALEQWRLNPARLRYLPNGIDLARFSSGAGVDVPGDGPLIGTVTALRPEKNLGRLIRAFAQAAATRPARLMIIGDGPERPRLEALTHELGIANRVLWPGHTTDPAPLLQSLDIFAMSSDTEQMPISLLEAMAASLPVAATDVGDIAAILPQQQRPYITPLNDTALATALKTLLDNPTLRTSLGQANRTRAEAEYTDKKMFAAWQCLFDAKS